MDGRLQNLSGLPRERESPTPAGKQMTVSLSPIPSPVTTLTALSWLILYLFFFSD